MPTAPRVTPAEVDASIKDESYTVLPNGRTTVCQLTLDNGFTVEGFSACVSIENFDAQLGRQMARQDAVSKVWPLLGFRLADKLTGTGIAPPDDTGTVVPSPRLPITQFRDGVFQTAASIKHYGPDAWFMANLQLVRGFPDPMNPIESARVYCNTHCNADGSLAGSSSPPVRFAQGNTPAEDAQLLRCNVTPYVYDVKPRVTNGYQLDVSRPLARFIGVKLGINRPNLLAFRAQTWDDVTEWFSRGQ